MKKNLGTALITGSAKRIGKALALQVASLGYDVVIHYNKSKKEAEKLKTEVEKKGVKCTVIRADLLDEKDVNSLVKDLKKIKNWNLLINNASIFNQSKFITSDISTLEKNFAIHVKVPAILSKALYENCLKNRLSGNIINMIDKNIVRNQTKYFDYILSKKSLAELTKMLALELAPQVRVNGIAPGFLSNVHGEDSEERTDKLISKIPLKRIANEDDILSGAKYLLTNNFLTGHILFIDGGASLNHAG